MPCIDKPDRFVWKTKTDDSYTDYYFFIKFNIFRKDFKIQLNCIFENE